MFRPYLVPICMSSCIPCYSLPHLKLRFTFPCPSPLFPLFSCCCMCIFLCIAYTCNSQCIAHTARTTCTTRQTPRLALLPASTGVPASTVQTAIHSDAGGGTQRADCRALFPMTQRADCWALFPMARSQDQLWASRSPTRPSNLVGHHHAYARWRATVRSSPCVLD